MDPAAPLALLHELAAAWEIAAVDFNQAGDDFSTDDIGKCFSALADEANLLTQLRCTSRIRDGGKRARPVWRLVQ